MKSPGKPSNKIKYLKSLNENDFPYLIADILAFSFGHSEIKVTDGTGDGKRDIYSLNQRGEKHLTQCKFHYDFNKTSGSSETDELPKGLFKFGYKNGCFATSGKISPQSKREFLDNYPSFTLEWLDGVEIAEKILENNLLYKIWVEDREIDKSLRSVFLPLILRQFPDDISLELSANSIKEIGFNLKKELLNPKNFYPYRDTENKTGVYVTTNSILGYEAEIENFFSATQISEAVEELLSSIKSEVGNKLTFVRFGMPYISNIIDKNEVQKIDFPYNPETFVIDSKEIYLEKYWLIDLSDKWKLPEMCQVSQGNWYCYLNHENDLALQIFYDSKIHEDQNATTLVKVNFEKLIWKKSLFLFGFEEDVNNFCKIQKPHEKYSTEPNAYIVAWFHPRPVFYLSDLSIVEQELFDSEFEKFKVEVSNNAKDYGLKEVSSEYAQKIAELSFPLKFNPNYVLNNTIDLFYFYEEISSPINPTKRVFIFEKIYKIRTDTDNLDEKLKQLFEKIESLDNKTLKIYLSEPDGREGVYFFHIKHSANFDGLELLSSKNLVEEIIEKELGYLKSIEQIVKDFFPSTQESTKYFLFQEIGFTFR